MPISPNMSNLEPMSTIEGLIITERGESVPIRVIDEDEIGIKMGGDCVILVPWQTKDQLLPPVPEWAPRVYVRDDLHAWDAYSKLAPTMVVNGLLRYRVDPIAGPIALFGRPTDTGDHGLVSIPQDVVDRVEKFIKERSSNIITRESLENAAPWEFKASTDLNSIYIRRKTPEPFTPPDKIMRGRPKTPDAPKPKKIKTNRAEIAERNAALRQQFVDAGIPVLGHPPLLPQHDFIV